MTNIIRLLPSINLGWTLYPAFEDRVVKFNREYLPETTPEQTGVMLQAMRQRWINDPVSSGYWLALDGSEVIGHACGWLAVDWNQPHVFVYQIESLTVEGLAERWIKELRGWVDEMNEALAARKSPTIHFVELATFHKPEVMERLLQSKGLSNFRHRAVLRFDV